MTDRMAQRMADCEALARRAAEQARTIAALEAENARLRAGCGRGAHLYVTNAVEDGQQCLLCGLPFHAAGKVT